MEAADSLQSQMEQLRLENQQLIMDARVVRDAMCALVHSLTPPDRADPAAVAAAAAQHPQQEDLLDEGVSIDAAAVRDASQ